jgi:predicted DNA-binding transcriptional regulator AlpA
MLKTETSAPAPLENLLSEKRLCEWLGISSATCSRWRLTGMGPPFIAMGPRRLAYRRGSVEKWMDDRERMQGALDAALRAERLVVQTKNAA